MATHLGKKANTITAEQTSPGSAVNATTLVSIGGSDFMLRSAIGTVVKPPTGPERYMPATILHYDTDTTYFGDTEFKKVCDEFGKDDVWTEDFLELLIIQRSNSLTVAEHIRNRVVKLVDGGEKIPVGPYVVHTPTGKVHGLLKLFEDTSNAFVKGVIPEGKDQYIWLNSIDKIPVPSRLYYPQPSDTLPLSGMRFGVKDSIDIAGLETGCGSKCYRSFYPAKQTSAPFINQLISAGAVLVGKMRCTQWCDGQDPLERLEEVSPINPRGDAFQKPSSSSSGSASGVASYPWLDFAIGTDTGGSIRHPAGVNGIYGIRPSHGSVESAGLICSELMDTPGVFARSATIARAASRVMARPSSHNGVFKPKKIRYKLLYAVESDDSDPCETPKFFPPSRRNSESKTGAGIIMDDFVGKLEEYLGCQRQEACIYDLWKETRHKNAPESLTEATGAIYQDIVYYELWNNIVKLFVREYQATHSGRMPFIEAITKARLDYGAKVSKEDYDRSVESLKTYATWVNEVLLPSRSATSETDIVPLLIYPQSWGVPHYRDEVARWKDGDNIFWRGFSAYSISYCSGCPDATIPLGEVKFHSRITKTDEYLPVAISMLAPRGEDEVLLKLIEDLEKNRILKPIKCGPRL
ncbi:amidase signature domain-containing protein [Hypoxylon trugodes]|uniref:amidase signature domain-containing protein n=1 Tax=Hypoxylon trugodes TaxID=326681 RepID=UPI002196B52E|nr:amidase signature domain-containing protein [Hypoxylon trugodes]KAI1383779.1 amidase signature domain-containing protein [Hypoxylon trugodes]